MNSLLRRPPPRAEERPVSSVRPVQSTPVPVIPRQASADSESAPSKDSSLSSLGGFPVNCLQKAGVFVQKIVTTTGQPTGHSCLFCSTSSFRQPLKSSTPVVLSFFELWPPSGIISHTQRLHSLEMVSCCVLGVLLILTGEYGMF